MAGTNVDEDHNFIIGQVYRDARTDDPLALVYLDTKSYILRDEQGSLRFGPRSELVKNVRSGRFAFSPEHEGFNGVGGLSRLLARAEDYRNKGGRKSIHYAEALTEAVSILTDDLEIAEPEPIPFEELDGIGDKAAKNLRQAGFKTDTDIRRADDSELTAVSWVGDKGVTSIRQYVEG